jgi:RecB family exonuclease
LDISTTEPLVTQEEVVRFSPSRLDAYEKCPVHWFINNFGGDGSGFEASIGTLLHSALELSRDGSDLVGYVESNWHTLEFEAQWQSQAQKRRALKMVHAISEYLATSGPVIAVEQKFELNLGRLQIAGKIDRVELTADGSSRVVDLKTGKVPSQAEVDEHRQLAVYQLALRQLGYQVSSGRIVAVGDQKLKVLEQPALEGDREEKIMALLEDVAIGASGSSFIAKFSEHCSQDSNCQLLISKAVTVG